VLLAFLASGDWRFPGAESPMRIAEEVTGEGRGWGIPNSSRPVNNGVGPC